MTDGKTLAELTVTFTAEAIHAYGGPGRHLHADVEAARALGFPDLVSWGTLTILPFSELLVRVAGPGWETDRSLSVRLSRPVCAGDAVTYSAAEDTDPGTLNLIATSSRAGVVARAQAVLRSSSTSDATGEQRL